MFICHSVKKERLLYLDKLFLPAFRVILLLSLFSFFFSFNPKRGAVRQLSAHVYSLENLWWWKIPSPSYLLHFTNVSFYLQGAWEAKKTKKKQKKQKPAIVKTMVFPVGMWELDHKEGWTLKNWCFGNVVLGKTLESPLDSREFKLVNPKGNQPWIFIWRTDAEAEAAILWPPDAKSWLTGKDSDAGKDWRQEEKGTTEDEMVVWHHQLNEHELEQTPEDGEGWGTWWAAVHGVAKSWTQLSDWTTTTILSSKMQSA